MGTHPIFESDFDCLTEGLRSKVTEGDVLEKSNCEDGTAIGQWDRIRDADRDSTRNHHTLLQKAKRK